MSSQVDTQKLPTQNDQIIECYYINRALLSPPLSGPASWQSPEALSMLGNMCKSVCIVCSLVPLEFVRYIVQEM